MTNDPTPAVQRAADVIFRADTMGQAGTMLAAMFGFGSKNSYGFVQAAALLSPYMIVVLLCAIIGCTPLPKLLAERWRRTSAGRAVGEFALMGLSLVLLGLSLMALAAESYNPFIYFRF